MTNFMCALGCKWTALPPSTGQVQGWSGHWGQGLTLSSSHVCSFPSCFVPPLFLPYSYTLGLFIPLLCTAMFSDQKVKKLTEMSVLPRKKSNPAWLKSPTRFSHLNTNQAQPCLASEIRCIQGSLAVDRAGMVLNEHLCIELNWLSRWRPKSQLF